MKNAHLSSGRGNDRKVGTADYTASYGSVRPSNGANSLANLQKLYGTQAAVDPVRLALDEMSAAGIPPADPSVLVADGRLHRYRVADDRSGSLNGYFVIHCDGFVAGVFGCWKRGIVRKFQSGKLDLLTPAQRHQQRKLIEQAIVAKAQTPEETERKRERQKRDLRQAAPIQAGDAVDRYFTAERGISLDHPPAVLRLADRFDYWHQDGDDKPIRIATLPAMLAAVQSPDGALCGLHITYLDDCGRKAELTHPATGERLNPRKLRSVAPGATRGGAVRLQPAGARLVVAEGIETALSAHLLTGRPAWACLSTSGMMTLELPAQVQDVLIAADHDANGAGEQAARKLARRLLAQGRVVRVAMPDQPGDDWNAVLQREVAV
jgi:hypothetical protein